MVLNVLDERKWLERSMFRELVCNGKIVEPICVKTKSIKLTNTTDNLYWDNPKTKA